ncbi:alcohol oxidase-like protein [Stachybotrys elegans]|uniref:Alcohol oxidase-like protein n=1 Tax=Stachybotrys elegans TaxID=80388 RepID=A0A8K0SDZ2_9HYPO|nr:alcohol oxidase-like protein [Stachybotrys elegans]
MVLFTKTAEGIDEVDVIIAGGGTAGCIVASRLAEASPDLSILVLEGGADNSNIPTVVNPALYLANLAPTSTTAIFYKSNKAEQLAQREVIVPSGGVLGGGSSINFLLYTRAQKDDFDSWNAPGWSSDELLPFLNKLETYHGPGDEHKHGHNGPIHVSDGPTRVLVSENDFLEAAKRVGYPEIRDLQNLTSNNGFQRWLRYISPDGKRQDTAHTYLHPKLQDKEKYPNLHVVVQAKVLRVLIDDETKHATGVEYIANPAFQAIGIPLTKQPKMTVRARRLVVVSCGACGTPPVLERSGVGNPAVLGRAGIPVVVDLPGVGHDYQDHNIVIYAYRTNLKPDETIDGILSGRDDVENLIATGNKLMGWNAVDVAGKIRPTEDEVDAYGPDFRDAWDRDFKHATNRPLMLTGLANAFLGDQASVPAGQYASIATYTAYPYSRGHMHITGPEHDDRLDFDVGYFSDAHDIDLKKLHWAYKKQREIMRRTKMYRGELAASHPRFPEGSNAACVEIDEEVDVANVKDIKYSAEDDAAIEAWLRENVGTAWHALGTAKMAPREQMGVVKPNLDVHGVTGLKVADLSIPPMNVGANTNNTALMIGEKAADIIIRELGL